MRSPFPRYTLSYAVVAAYAIVDTTDRGMRAYWRTHPPQQQPQPQVRRSSAPPVATVTMASRTQGKLLVAAPTPATKNLSPVAATVLDSFLWHAAASLLLPYIVINRTVWAASKALAHHPRLSPTLRHSLPSLAGLAMIPLVVPHIDHAVDKWMDSAVRPRLNLLPAEESEKKHEGGGGNAQQQWRQGNKVQRH